MSLALGHIWIQKTIRQPAARTAAMQQLERAAAQHIEATLIIGPKLTTNSKCYLARWDGRELAVTELSSSQQDDWKVNPHGLFKELHHQDMPKLVPTTTRLVAISDFSLHENIYDGWAPMTGTCRYDFNESQPSYLENTALRAEYFWPGMPRRVTAMWYAEGGIAASNGVLKFSFPPLFSENNPYQVSGTLALFVQLFTADNWVQVSGCRRISNIATALVRLR
jgi:hypothetical protein